MQLPSRLRLGCVEYLNAQPLINGWSGEVDFDSPAALSAKLQANELDVALVPSFEYLRHPLYAIVDGLAIASQGAVYSVFLAYVGELHDVQEIETDPASQTSVNLLRCLLAEYHGMQPRLAPQTSQPGQPVTAARAKLLIGNQAILFRQHFGGQCNYLDLGEAWTRLTSLPFVYALWLVRPEYSEGKFVAEKLRAQLKQNLAYLDRVAGLQTNFEPDFCTFYWTTCLRFTFGEQEKLGLQTFGELCAKYRLFQFNPAPMKLV